MPQMYQKYILILSKTFGTIFRGLIRQKKENFSCSVVSALKLTQHFRSRTPAVGVRSFRTRTSYPDVVRDNDLKQSRKHTYEWLQHTKG